MELLSKCLKRKTVGRLNGSSNFGCANSLSPVLATLRPNCNSTSCQPIELERCSNPVRMGQIFSFRFKIFFRFGFGILCGCRYTRECFRDFWPSLPGPRPSALGAKPTGIFLAQVCLEARLKSAFLEPLIGFLA